MLRQGKKERQKHRENATAVRRFRMEDRGVLLDFWCWEGMCWGLGDSQPFTRHSGHIRLMFIANDELKQLVSSQLPVHFSSV